MLGTTQPIYTPSHRGRPLWSVALLWEPQISQCLF